MFGFEITKILSKNSDVYKNIAGLVDGGKIPKKIGCHRFLILNIENHWVVLHRTVQGND